MLLEILLGVFGVVLAGKLEFDRLGHGGASNGS
jgi:hypothetical protein